MYNKRRAARAATYRLLKITSLDSKGKCCTKCCTVGLIALQWYITVLTGHEKLCERIFTQIEEWRGFAIEETRSSTTCVTMVTLPATVERFQCQAAVKKGIISRCCQRNSPRKWPLCSLLLLPFQIKWFPTVQGCAKFILAWASSVLC